MDTEGQNQVSNIRNFTITIVTSELPADITAIRDLFTEYVNWLSSNGIDLAFQSYASEFLALPGKYAISKGGCLLLARATDRHQTPLGCVALRPLQSPKVAEMKRLWVRPEARSLSLGRELVASILGKARILGYGEVKLDTLPFMTKARKMYASFGFQECESYYDTPIRDTVFLSYQIPPDEEADVPT